MVVRRALAAPGVFRDIRGGLNVNVRDAGEANLSQVVESSNYLSMNVPIMNEIAAAAFAKSPNEGPTFAERP
jgi:hypothetical protein